MANIVLQWRAQKFHISLGTAKHPLKDYRKLANLTETVPENFTKGLVAKRQSKTQQNYAHWNRNADYCLRLPGLNGIN